MFYFTFAIYFRNLVIFIEHFFMKFYLSTYAVAKMTRIWSNPEVYGHGEFWSFFFVHREKN